MKNTEDRFPMGKDLLAIRWNSPESKGYTDLFPTTVFARKGATEEFTHAVLGPQGGYYEAKCRLTVHDTTADLDYEAFPEFNNRWGMYLGVLRLQLTGTRLDALTEVYWRDRGRKRFAIADVDIVDNPLPTPSAYQRRSSTARKAKREIRERPGQVRFRSILMLAYGGRCCISGCCVGEALEGAHIDPFSGKSSDHPQNGLLLRRDLHALFDAGFLAIDPTSHLVHCAASVQIWPEYMKLHKIDRLAEPVYGGPSYRPSNEALKKRWRDFKRNEKRHGAA